MLGNLSELEVIADVLTSDALQLKEGVTRVELQPATGARKLNGRVKLIEPAGFTKLSSLGVEQQRVNVIVSFDNVPEDLGVEYRLQARFLTAAKDDALVIPRFTLMEDPDGSHFVFVIVDGRLAKRTVQTGLENDTEVEITDGLDESDVVVLRPDATLEEGMRAKSTSK